MQNAACSFDTLRHQKIRSGVQIMEAYAHKTKSGRKIITTQEWADFCHVSRGAISAYLQKYQAAGLIYDPRDIYSVLEFYNYLLKVLRKSA